MSIYAKVQKPPKEEFETVKRKKIAKVITTQVFFYFLGFLLVLKGNAVEEKQTSSSFANEKKYI